MQNITVFYFFLPEICTQTEVNSKMKKQGHLQFAIHRVALLAWQSSGKPIYFVGDRLGHPPWIFYSDITLPFWLLGNKEQVPASKHNFTKNSLWAWMEIILNLNQGIFIIVLRIKIYSNNNIFYWILGAN